MNKHVILLILLLIVVLTAVTALWLWYAFGTPPEEPDAPGGYEPFSLAVRYVVQFVSLAVRMPHSGDV